MKQTLSILLTFLLAATSTACLCAAPVSEPMSDASAAHAHHGQHQMQDAGSVHPEHVEARLAMSAKVSTDCSHSDCDTGCSDASNIKTDVEILPPATQKLEKPQDIGPASLLPFPVIAFASPPARRYQVRTPVFSNHTPIQRKDRLIE